MNVGDFFKSILHIIGILGNGNSTDTTGLTTVGNYNGTTVTPIIFDNTSFINITSGTDTAKHLTTILGMHSSSRLPDALVTVTGITPGTEIAVTNGTETPGNTTSESPTTGNVTVTTVSEPTTDSNVTDITETVTLTDATTDDGNTTITDTTGNVTVTAESTTDEGNITTITDTTGNATTTSGQTTVPSGSSTEPAPTEKPGLSRGSVAGIVIGCLLLVAIVIAAVVFFVKNRGSSSETQRLRV